MKIRVEVVCSDADSNEQRREVLTIERQQLAMETLGMSLSEGKAVLAGVQDFVIVQQAHEYLEQRRTCPACARRTRAKIPELRQSKQYSVPSIWRTRDGTAALVRLAVLRRSAR